MTDYVLRVGPDIRRWIMLGLVFLTPLAFLRNLNDPINVPKIALLIIGISVVAGIRLAELGAGASADGLKPLLVPAGAIAAALLAAWLFSPFKAWALWGNYPRLLGLIPYLLTTLFGVLLVDALRDRGSEIAWALAASATVVAGYGLIQIAGLDPFTWFAKGVLSETVATSTLGNSNFVGGFLAICIPVALVRALEPSPRRPYAIAMFLVVTAGWLLTRSEAGWAGGIAGVAVVLGYRFSKERPRAQTLGIAVAAVIFTGVVGSVLLSIAAGEAAPVPPTVARRGEWWQGAISMAGQSPLVGRGPSAYALEGTRYRTLEDARQVTFDYTDDPHSIFLSFLTSAGIVGLVGLFGALGWAIRRGLRLDPENALAVAFFGGVVGYLVEASVSIDTVALRTAFWTVLGGLMTTMLAEKPATRTTRDRKGRRDRAKRVQRPPAQVGVGALLLGVSIAAFGAWYGFGFAATDARFMHASRVLEEGRGSEALQLFEEVRNARDDTYYRRVMGRSLGSIAVGLAAQGEDTTSQQLYATATDAFAYSLELPHSNSVVDYARFLLAWADSHPEARERALALYDRALRLDPQNPSLQEEAAAARSGEEEA